MPNVKITVNFEKVEFKVAVDSQCTVAMLMIKLRRYIKLRPEEALFIFFIVPTWTGFSTKEVLYGAGELMSEVQEKSGMTVLKCNLLRESTFGSWGRMFCCAKIEKKKELYVSSIKYSWYGLSYFTEVEVFETLEEAKSHILKERCAGGLTLDV